MTADGKDSASASKGAFSRLLLQSGIYAVGNVLIKASGLILAPIYLNTTFLSQQSYGYLALLEISGQLAALVIGMGVGAAVLKYMADDALGEARSTIPMTAWLTVVATAVVAVVILSGFAPSIAGWILEDRQRASLVRWFSVYVALKAVGVIPFTLIRFHERAITYVVAALCEIGVLVAAVYYFLVVLGLELEGVIYAFVLSAAVATTILTVVMLLHVRWKFDAGMSRRILRYGAPLAIGGLALPVLHAGDRYLLQWLTDASEVAVYAWAGRISGILNMMFVQSFSLAFTVIGIKALSSRASDASLHRRTLRHYLIWAGWCALALSLFAHDFTLLMSNDGSYLDAAPLVLPLSIGYLGYGLYVIFVNILYASERTKRVAANVVVAAIINVLLNLLLIPTLGKLGAAVATLVSYGVLALITARSAKASLNVTVPWAVLAGVLAVVTALALLGYALLDLPRVLRLVAYAGILAAYVPAVFVLRLYRMDEIRSGVAFVKDRWLHGGDAAD